METRTFHYAKRNGISLFITVILITSLCAFAIFPPVVGLWLYFIFVPAVAFCLYVLYYLLRKWLIPASRNEPAITIDDKTITLNTSYTPIKWKDIDTLYSRGGEDTDVIGIRLKNLDKFLAQQPTVKKGKILKFNQRLYGFHFSISVIQIEESDVYDVLNDYFSRFGEKG